jgi:quinoprotein glucose dehydrogenase
MTLPFARLTVWTTCVGLACALTMQGQSARVDAQRAAAPSPDRHKTWKDYGGGPDSSKFLALDQITKSNVNRLQVAWTYPTGDNNVYGFNPIIVDDMMYVLARNSSLVALNAVTGKEIWIHENLRGIARRGVNYWESKDRSERRILFQMNNYLQAIDARTGKSILAFGKNGLVDLREGLGREAENVARAQSNTPGKIFDNLILLGVAPGEAYMSTPGYLRAYDVRTGALVWTFRTVPLPGEYGYDTWPKDAHKYVGGANTWGEISVDEQRGIAYFPTGSPTYDYYGADRIGSNLFGNCLLALDARTGKRLWHFQVVHHDLWDYDLTAAPQLITVRHKGKTIDAVAQASKHGFMFVFDRVTGEPLWPIEERPVPKSDMPGEQAWPTQPFPTVVPPFNRQTVTVEDMTPYLLSPEERETFKQRIAAARTGLFTPLSTQETIAMPGAVGGANLGNTAANPAAGMVYVMTQDFPSFYKLSETMPNLGPPRGAAGAAGGPGGPGQAMFAQTCQACHSTEAPPVAASGSPAAAAGTAVGPSLANLGARMAYEDFKQIVNVGRGHMPAFPQIDDDAMRGLYGHLSGNAGTANSGAAKPTGGPVVASGGAPGGSEMRRPAGFRPGAAVPYPEGVEAPSKRFYTGYGLSYPFILSPPWSSLVAYDLNTGAIKWRVPLGEDRDAVAEGAKGTGLPRGSQRMGMVVTSAGLVFATARDGKVRAFDADTGATIWTFDLPHGAEGIPSMYAVDGRQYLVVSSTTTLVWGRKALGGTEPWVKKDASTPPGGYVVFALPEKGTADQEDQQ